jgi:hypothetical protein
MCQSHQTRQWHLYSAAYRELADHIVSPWVVLTDRCHGPHLPTGPDGSYSLLQLVGDPTVAERVVKVFIMEEDRDPLSAGVYVGIRSHSTPTGIPGRSPAEQRIWNAAFQAEPLCAPFFGMMNPTANSIGLMPQHQVCFAYFLVPPTPRLADLTNLTRFLERCRQQYG